MAGWREVLIKDVAYFQEGPGLRNWQWANSGVKVINGRNILLDGQIDLANTDKFISLDEFQSKYQHFGIQANDIVVTSSGTLGKVGRIRSEYLPLMMNTSVIRFRSSNNTVLNDDFLFCYLRSSHFQQQIISYAIGAAQANFGPSHIKLMSIPLPPLLVQQRIAAVLSAYDNLMENSHQRIRTLESMASALYRAWFVNFRFPGKEDLRLIASTIGDIPRGWKVVSLDAIKAEQPYAINGGPFGSKLGTKDYVDEGVPVIRGSNLSESGRFNPSEFAFVSQQKAEELRANLAVPGDIVVTQRGTLGQIGMIPTGIGYNQFVISQSQMKITLDPKKVNRGYAFFFLRSEEATQRLKNMASSSGVPHINLAVLREFQTLLPPLELQEQFGKFALSTEAAIEALTRQVRNLRQTRDLLLPRLLSGQVSMRAD